MHDGPVYVAKRNRVATVRVSELYDIGVTSIQLMPRKKSAQPLRFRQIPRTSVGGSSGSGLSLARQIRGERCSFEGTSGGFAKYLKVTQIRPAAADAHVVETAAAGRPHAIGVRTDHRGLRLAFGLPILQQLDCRPWRCRTCEQAGTHRSWQVSWSDIVAACPDVLRCPAGAHQKEHFF